MATFKVGQRVRVVGDFKPEWGAFPYFGLESVVTGYGRNCWGAVLHKLAGVPGHTGFIAEWLTPIQDRPAMSSWGKMAELGLWTPYEILKL